MKKKKPEVFDLSFYRLADNVTRAIASNKDGTTQEQQVEELLDAERKFKEAILRYSQSTAIYKKFLQLVCVTNKNILSARPYFREKNVSFSKNVTPAIKNSDIEALKTFDINFQFIQFVKENWLGPFPKRAGQLYDRVYTAREVLIENNMPLAMNRAKLFYRKVPKSHLTLTDLVNESAVGLAIGIDKWCGKYSPVFRSVCIGRMVGNMIDAYSETTMHFYPQDRRILYKANSIRGRQGIEEINELTEAVNKSFKEDGEKGINVPKKPVTVSELSNLLAAASIVSADASLNEEGFGIYHFTPDENSDIENDFIERETKLQMLTLAKNLTLIQRKVLKLKGIKL